MAIASPLSIQNINSSVRSLSVAVTRVKRSAFATSNILMNRTKVKRASLFENRRLFQRKRESIRRRDQESLIEASSLVTPIQRGTAAIARSTKGFLGRILDFTASLITGWLLYNLPTLIGMAQELMARITRMVSLLRGFVTNLGNVMTGFGNLLNASFQNIISFDFFDTSKRVDTAMKNLNNTFVDMGSQIDEGIKLLTTPLTEGLVGAEEIPEFGTRYPSQPETTPSGTLPSAASPEMYRIAAALSTEGSGSQSNADMMQVVVNRKASGKYGATYTDILAAPGQFAGVQRRPGGANAFKRIQTIEDAAKWSGQSKGTLLKIIQDIQNPRLQANAAQHVRGALEFRASAVRYRRLPGSAWRGGSGDNQFLLDPSKDPILKGGASPFNMPEAEQPKTSTPAQKPKLDLNKLGFSVGEIAGYSASRGRVHSGRDIAIAAGTPVSVISDATITDVGFEKGYGYFVAYTDSKGIEHFYGHLREMPKVRKGQKLSAGTIVGYVGSTGRSTGPHLHWEVSPRIGEVGRPRRNIIDPIQYGFSSSAPFGGTTPAQVQPQGMQARQQLPTQITPERQGPQIILIDDVQPQQSMPMSAGGGGAIIPIVINPLNSYITNKLLLDLAYT